MKRAIVVGSGAGGAMAARELADAFAVTVLEAGPEFRPFGSDLEKVDWLRKTRLPLDPRLIRLLLPSMHVSVASHGMPLICGVATGGSTTLATGNALRCDEALLRIGIDLSREFEELSDELPISTGHERRWRPVTRELFSACEGLGLNPVATPKLVDYSRCTRCGRCVLGCPTGAKWDSRSLLEQAAKRGARVVTHSKVERLVLNGSTIGPGCASGVVVRRGTRAEFLAADLVVLAAGGLGTPAILKRSGLPTEDRLFVDPVLCVAGPAVGCHADEDVPMPFFVQGDDWMISPYFDYFSFFFDRAWRGPRHDIVALMIKLADSETGSVSGRRKVAKSLTVDDRRRLATATESCIEILGQFGVQRNSVFLGTLNAGHPGGTVPLSGRERHEMHSGVLPDNVYVADASLLPRSLGRPPILTIMALAKRVAHRSIERIG